MNHKKIFSLLLLFILSLNSGKAVTYYLISAGNITSKNNWSTSPLGTTGGGVAPTAFNSPGDIWNFSPNTLNGNRTSAGITNGLFAVHATATVVVGSSFNLTIGTATAGSVAGFISVSNSGTLTISNSNAVNFGDIGNTSTIIYNAVGQTVPARIFGNLVVNQSMSLTGTGTSLDVNGLLTLSTNVTFDLNSKDLNLNGTSGSIAGTGSLTGTANSRLFLQGGNSGANTGTLYFANGNNNLFSLEVNYDLPGDCIALGTDLNIVNNGLVWLYYGCLNLNGKTFSVTAGSDCNFTYAAADGVIKAGGGSLFLSGSVGGNSGVYDLFVDGTSNVFKSIYLNNNSSLNIGSAVIISDSISANLGTIDLGGNVTLKADASKTARVGMSAGSFLGNMTVETYLPGGLTGWTNLGSPGVSGQTIASWDTYVTSGGTTGLPLACSGCYYGLGYSNGFNSVYSWSEPLNDYVAATAATALSPAEGFWIYTGTGFSSTTPLKLVNTGAPVQGPVNYGITRTTGSTFNLLSNPYASPISWDKTYNLGSNSSLVMNAIYIYNPDLAITTSYAGFVSSHAAGANNVIPAGQGFYVEAQSAGTVTFDESVKLTSNTSANPVLRGAKSNYIGQVFRVKLDGKDGDWDETAFRIHPMATPVYDGAWDAHKIFQSPGYAGYPGAYSKYTTISSKDALGEDYSIHSFPEPSKDLSIPLLVRVMQSGTYTITASGLENIPSCLILKDKLLNKTQDLQMGDYVFTINDTTSTPRFELQLCKGVAPANSIAETKIDARSVQILRAENGIQVNTVFAENTRAKIEVFNLLGQSLYSAVTVDGTTNSTFIPVDLENTMVLVKVSTANDSFSKKVLLR